MQTHPGWTTRRFGRLASAAILLALAATLCSCLKEYPPADVYVGEALEAAAARCNPVAIPLPTTQPVGTSQPEALHRVEPPATGPLRLTVQNAVLLALENNLALIVDKINPQITQTFETQALAVFDPLVAGQIAYGRTANRPPGSTTSPPVNAVDGNIGVSAATPLGGSVAANLDTTSSIPDAGEGLVSTRASLAVTQNLLRGAGLDVNLASIRQARLDTLSSLYQLRGFAEQLVNDVQISYWAYVLAQQQIDIVIDSLKIAKEQVEQTKFLIKVGKGAETDIVAAEAEVALREENLIDARSSLVQAKLKLLQLINPGGAQSAGGSSPSLWDRDIEIFNKPVAPEVDLDDVELHVQVALKLRSDLNQARLQVKRGDLQIVKTKNGLLPQLELFLTLGKTGYSESFGASVSNIFARNSYDVLAGVSYSQSPLNRAAMAQDRQAGLSRDQAVQSVNNLAQTVQVDVRSAYEELKRTGQQVKATAASRRLAEQTLAAETEKFKVGRSYNLLVAQAERDLLTAQLNEVQAVVNNLDAFVALFKLEGSLLERMGVQAPGCETAPSD